MEQESIQKAYNEIKNLVEEFDWQLKSDNEADEFVKEYKRKDNLLPWQSNAKFVLALNNKTENYNLFVIWFENGEVKEYETEEKIKRTIKPIRSDYQGAMVRADVLINNEITSSSDYYFDDEEDRNSFIEEIIKSEKPSLEDFKFF